MALTRKQLRELRTGLGFLAPNICGVLIFVVFPVIFSIVRAFSNWDLRFHNMFKSEPIKFVGLDNFIRLITEADFLRYLGNTLFLMMGIPFCVGGALCSAMLLSRDTRGGGGKVYLWLLGSALLIAGVVILTVTGMGATGMVILLTGLACGILIMGMLGGVTVYRTLFYTPHFTAGVATFLLWKKLYDPYGGPINAGLTPILEQLSNAVNAIPAGVVSAGLWLSFALMLLVFWRGIRKLRIGWRDGDLGWGAAIPSTIFLCLPMIIGIVWTTTRTRAWIPGLAALLILTWQIVAMIRRGKEFPSKPMDGVGSGLMLGLAGMVGQFVLLGLGAVLFYLPEMAKAGLGPPHWIHDYNWAKPSLMMMGFWAAIGSNTMLLYLAALTNVPQDLYEAADIDGANRFQKFWNVTWPQLAPTTFFIVVMATIGGLQGGFEMARTMTRGGPAGATTTLSYFIYLEGFETGRLSFAAAVAWALFILVFAVTMFNWKFGNKYVNE